MDKKPSTSPMDANESIYDYALRHRAEINKKKGCFPLGILYAALQGISEALKVKNLGNVVKYIQSALRIKKGK